MRAQYLPNEVIQCPTRRRYLRAFLYIPPFVQNQALGSSLLCRKQADKIEDPLRVCYPPIRHLERIARGMRPAPLMTMTRSRQWRRMDRAAKVSASSRQV